VSPRAALRVRSFAKVNLGLEVLGQRQDGYHELRTLFQTIDLHDDLVLREARRDVVVRCTHPAVPTDETNLAGRAASLLRRFARVSRGVEIGIEKRIPVGGGLGGGSSNAAAVLMALDRMWGLGLGPDGLMPLARKLGADVPFFLVGGTALGLARGDEVYPLYRQVSGHLVVIDTGRPVSTARVFARMDASLTPRENSYNIFRFVSCDLGGSSPLKVLTNELETAALEEAPELRHQVRRIRGFLVRDGALLASLSGSGSSYFGLFGDARRAGRSHAALRAAGFMALRSRTLSLDQYRRSWHPSPGPARAAKR
jgi:4-diphosphocytidyl-2-C-methyl-D-erythritol kinase